ncbi:MAG TPA: BppU family phage baseplate upper protein [Feifaniaceae bacterium]|nr:BppU family phage baseplate upper protein [Feifaniaceae bacterium]
MVQKRFSIALDIKRPTANRDFEVVEGDNSNVLEVTLTDDGAPVDLEGSRISAVFSKSDGNTAQQDTDGHGVAVTPPNGLTISLYTTSVAPGLVECELQVYSGEGNTVLSTSAKFNFMCRRGIANDDTIEATDEWPLLVGMMRRVEAAEEAELLRAAAEGGRVSAESGRVSAESTRVSAENARNTAEGTRAAAEAGRISAESGRVTAESGRVSAENTRITNENARIPAESARAAAEGTRVNQEAGRVTAEFNRVAAENARVTRDIEYRRLEPYDPAASYVPLNKVTYEGSCYQCVQAVTGVVPTNTDHWALIAAAGEGSGDMLKATYDADNDGVVDDAEKLGGQLPAHYATAAGLSAHAGNTSNPHGVTRQQVGAPAPLNFQAWLLGGGEAWTGAGPYTQTVAVPGITAAMVPVMDFWFADGEAVSTYIGRLGDYAKIDRVVANDGSITATCLQSRPDWNISIKLRVVQ